MLYLPHSGMVRQTLNVGGAIADKKESAGVVAFATCCYFGVGTATKNEPKFGNFLGGRD
jgi:hypothetical protein